MEIPDDPTARDPRASVGWDALLIADLAIVGIGALLGIVAYFAGWLEPTEGSLTDQQILFARIVQWVAIILGTIMFGVIPVVWAGMTRVGRWGALPAYFGLHRPALNLSLGALAGIALAFAIGGALVGAEHLGWLEESEQEAQLLMILTWPMIIALSLQAGITEEFLFRGVIQSKIGPWWQALLFGLAHFQQGWLGFFVTGLIGLAFGLLRARGISLYALIAAHVFYDLTLLTVAKAWT